MADNRPLDNLTGNAAADEITHAGDTALVQVVRPVGIAGAEGSKTLVEIVGTAGSAAAGTLSVQGIASGVPLAVSDNDGSLTVDGTVTATPARATAATLANVSDAASSATLLASNAARLVAILYNDSTVGCYVKYGDTASATSFTYFLDAYESYREEVYTGRIDGIWESDASGAVRVTELTAS